MSINEISASDEDSIKHSVTSLYAFCGVLMAVIFNGMQKSESVSQIQHFQLEVKVFERI